MALEETISSQPVVKPAVKLRVDTVIFRFQEGEGYAFASASLLDEDGVTVEGKTLPLTEAELAGWGSDDTFVLELVKSKLGLQTIA
jgi:hypothetical protein